MQGRRKNIEEKCGSKVWTGCLDIEDRGSIVKVVLAFGNWAHLQVVVETLRM